MYQVMVFHPPSYRDSSVYLLCSLSFFCIPAQVHYKGMCHMVTKQITAIRNAETKLAEGVTLRAYFYSKS
jgi:hypothetical protein